MEHDPLRRNALLGLGMTAGAAMLGAAAKAANETQEWLPEGAAPLKSLAATIARSPRRRDFRTVPMVLVDPDQWDHEAITVLMRYHGSPKQVWDNNQLAGPWLNLMRNMLNTQVWSFRHPDFLIVSATHASAHLALFDQATWDKYQLSKLTDGKFPANTFIMEQKAASADLTNFQDPDGAFSPHDNSIPALQRRGAVFLGCHNAIWEISENLMKAGSNPDRLSHEALAAELTNHLIPGAVLTPGAIGTLLELQQAGFHYAT